MATHENTNPNLGDDKISSLPKDILYYYIFLRFPVHTLLRLKSVSKLWLSLISNPCFIKTHLSVSSNDIVSWLPKQMSYDILSKCTVKDLLRLRSVCKSWLSLISSHDFIKAHLTISTNDPHFTRHRLLLITGPYMPSGEPDFYVNNYLFSLSVYSLLDDEDHSHVDKAIQVYDPPMKYSEFIVGCCHGLVCLTTATIDEPVCVWNPSTRKSRTLPKLDVIKVNPRADTEYGFCYDESNDDFKVFAIFGSSYKLQVSVYSLKSDCWRLIGDFPFGEVMEGGKFANGAIHWHVKRSDIQLNNSDSNIIVSLDIKTETYQQVLLPKYEEGASNWTLGTFENNLSLLYKFSTFADFWVKKECVKEEPWMKLFTIPYKNGPIKGDLYIHSIISIYVNHGIILNLDMVSCMELYYFKDKIFKSLFDSDFEHVIDEGTYVESLVSPHL